MSDLAGLRHRAGGSTPGYSVGLEATSAVRRAVLALHVLRELRRQLRFNVYVLSASLACPCPLLPLPCAMPPACWPSGSLPLAFRPCWPAGVHACWCRGSICCMSCAWRCPFYVVPLEQHTSHHRAARVPVPAPVLFPHCTDSRKRTHTHVCTPDACVTRTAVS